VDYAAALNFLASLVNYERHTPRRYDTRAFDLERFGTLLERLGSPQNAFPIVHVAGTKGKGSVCATLVAALGAAGRRAGAFTSPHLRSPRERITLGGEMISPDDFAASVGKVKAAMTGGEAPNYRTYFETVLAAALLYFREQAADVAVLEAGLGGRLDATNVVTPVVVAITSLGLEHTDILGDTIEAIAAEKAGVIKPGVPTVSAPQRPAAAAVLKEAAAGRGAPLFFVGEDLYFSANGDGSFDYRGPRYELRAIKPATPGDAQRTNAAVALAALERFAPFRVAAAEARQGVETARLRARAELVAGAPATLLDGAHTVAAARELLSVIQQLPHDNKVLLWGMSAGKDAKAFAQALAAGARAAVVTAAQTPRAEDPQRLLAAAAALFEHIETVTPAEAALARARALAGERGLVIVAGSFYLAGEILTILEGPVA